MKEDLQLILLETLLSGLSFKKNSRGNLGPHADSSAYCFVVVGVVFGSSS
jgi:hypothetical protein